ncbi:MAG TPA: oligosaccharide flippase family protein [Candidatus Binatia bacterium]
MLNKFRTLLGHTVIYGLGNYGIKIIGFLLIPLYTRYLTTADYGVMALVSMYTQVMFILMNLGQSTSLFRFYYEHDTEEGRERVVAASLWIVILFAVPLAAVPFLFNRPLADLILGSESWWFLMCLGTATVLCKVLLRMPFAIMRANDQSKRYAAWSLARNALGMVLAVVLVAVFHLGATGVVLSQFLAELVFCFLLTGVTFRMLRAGFHWQDIKEQLLFGLPFVPVGAASFTLDLTNRWFLKHYYSTSEVGIFSLGYRFAEILTFVVTAFQLSWPQFLFRHRKEENAPRLYADMTAYYLALMLFLWLNLAVFAPELLRIMATPAFYPAAAVIPIISFALVFDGMGFMFNIGALFSKKTILRTISVTTAAVVNVTLNFILIPRYGMMGAAWATFIGFLVQMSTTLLLSLRVYHVPYRYGRMLIMLSAALGIYAASTFVETSSVAASIALKIPLILLYPAALLASGLFDPKDVASALMWVERRVPQAAVAVRYVRPLLPGVRDATGR